MPIYKPETDPNTGETTHKFIYRVYKDGKIQRRVYKDKELVYSLYDVNYHYGQEEETGGKEPSGAYIPDDQKIVKNDVWGHVTELNTAEYEDIEYGPYEYWDWYKATADKDHANVDEGFIDPSSYLGTETEIDNREDYNLYIVLMRSSVVGNRTIKLYTEYGYCLTYDEAVELASDMAYEANAYAITGYKVSGGSPMIPEDFIDEE